MGMLECQMLEKMTEIILFSDALRKKYKNLKEIPHYWNNLSQCKSNRQNNAFAKNPFFFFVCEDGVFMDRNDKNKILGQIKING